MSTRCNVIVEDFYEKIMIYRHSDGYPGGEHGVLVGISDAMKFAWRLPRFEASDFSSALVRAWKNSAGNIRLCSNLVVADDAEWLYTIRAHGGRAPFADPEKVTVKIEGLYSGGTFEIPLEDAWDVGIDLPYDVDDWPEMYK